MKNYKYIPQLDISAYELSEILKSFCTIPDYIPDSRYNELTGNTKRHFVEDK